MLRRPYSFSSVTEVRYTHPVAHLQKLHCKTPLRVPAPFQIPEFLHRGRVLVSMTDRVAAARVGVGNKGFLLRVRAHHLLCSLVETQDLVVDVRVGVPSENVAGFLVSLVSTLLSRRSTFRFLTHSHVSTCFSPNAVCVSRAPLLGVFVCHSMVKTERSAPGTVSTSSW